MKKFAIWAVLSLFLLSPYGAFAQSIPGGSALGGASVTVLPPLPLPTGASTSALQLPDGHNVTVDNAAGGSAVNIQDGGNSLTVDGTFFQATQPISAASLPLPTGAATETTLATVASVVDTEATSRAGVGVAPALPVVPQ